MAQSRIIADRAFFPPRSRLLLPKTSAVRRMLRIKTAAFGLTFIGVVVIGALLAPLLARYDPNALGAGSASLPSWSHPLGQDLLGRDQFSRLLYGARMSLAVSLLATGFGATCGSIIGLLAAYFRGWVDRVLMRAMDALLALPGLVLPLALLASLGAGLPTVSLALGIAFTPVSARLMRGQALSVLSREYITAAIATGARGPRIVFRHVAPNCMAPIIVQASLAMGVAVIAEASLSFLGVGITPPTPTWGTMLADAFDSIRTQPWLVFAPGAAIFLLVLSFNFVGDALRDVLDPRLRGGV